MRLPQQSPPGPDTAGVAPESLLPVVLTVDDADSPRDVIDALAIAPFVTGQHPYAVSKDLDNVRSEATLLPVGALVLRDSSTETQRARLAGGDGWTLHVVHFPRTRTATVTVTARTAALAGEVLESATAGMTEPPPPTEGTTSVGFWHLSRNGPRRDERRIAADPWTDIRQNYASSARAEFDRLMTLGREDVRGRLLLVHGPPGTGKTTALRTLAHAWRSWCQVDCVLDPEALFGQPEYLLNVALSRVDDDADTDGAQPRWRLLLLEDCDELIRGEAKQRTGQALSRLLNLTDGLLGQGRRVLVAITTNEDLTRLHPAVTRAGRSLARIEVPPLPVGEAVAWLGSSVGVPQGGATLADLYALREDDAPPPPEPVAIGQYL